MGCISLIAVGSDISPLLDALGADSDEYRGITLSAPYRLLTVRQAGRRFVSPLESCGHFTMGLPTCPNDPSGQNQ